MKKIIYSIIIMLLISVMLISSYFLYKNQKDDKIQENIFENLTKIAVNTEEKQENIINIDELYSINNDIVGWLKIEDSNINYPVMQTKNSPNYYLKRNFYKEYSNCGTPYIAEYCDIEKSDNVIIYGHHIKGNKIFGELENYKKEEYYKNHKIIKFYTKDKCEEYEIIAVFKTIAYTGFNYYKFYNAQDEGEFETFINKCKELSFYEIERTAIYGDKLLTLSTCEYSNTNGRLVVVARKII